MQIFIGIDPGKTGAISVLKLDGLCPQNYRFAHRNPLEVFDEVLAAHSIKIIHQPVIILEAVHAYPGQGLSSTFAFAEGFGALQGYLYANGLRFDLVSPQRWQGILPPAEDPKARARAFCDSQWGLDAFVFPNCRTPDQGAMDAACLSEYGRRVSLGLIAAAPVKAKKKPRRAIRLAG